MVGLTLAQALKKPTSPGGPWKVHGVARRPLPTWYPADLIDGFMSFDAINYSDTSKNLSPIAHQLTHVFWVAVQRRDSEEVNISLNSAMLKNVLEVLRLARPSRLRHLTLQTGTKHYMGPIFDPVLGLHLVHHDSPFREDSPRLPYPNYYYAMEDLVASYANSSFTYSVHRSSFITGTSSRSEHNAVFTLSLYAIICKHEGLPFRYPGTKYTWEHFCDMSDARLLADQQIWAAFTDGAKNQAYNCTNGDVFTWKSMWKVLCEIFDVEFVPFDETEEFDIVDMMKDKGKVWEDIVEKHGLYETKWEEISCFDSFKTVLSFDFQHVCSMNKSRQFGFFGYVNTLESIKMWVGKYRDIKILP